MLAQTLWGFPTKAAAGGDPSFGNVSLLLHGDGTNGSTVITDSSSFANTVSVVGNAAISSTQSKFGGGSIYFDGSGDYLSLVSNPVNTTGNFTVETWFYTTSTNYQAIFSPGHNTNSFATLRLATTGTSVSLLMSTNGTSWAVLSGEVGTISVNTWNHLALTRDGGLIRLFLNGTLVYSSTALAAATALFNGTNHRIGSLNYPTAFSYFSGYIDEFRITKGVARYTADFIPPSRAFPEANPGTFDFSSGAVAASGVNVSSLTVALPADIREGDLLFCHGLIQHATSAGSISGWTNQSVPGDYGTYSFTTATGSESGNVTVNLSAAARCTAVITRVRHSSGITPKVSRYVSGVYSSNPTITLTPPLESHFSVAHLIDYWKDTTFSLSGLNSNMSQLAQRTTAPAHYSGVIQTSALGLTGSTVGVTTATQISAIANAVYV